MTRTRALPVLLLGSLLVGSLALFLQSRPAPAATRTNVVAAQQPLTPLAAHAAVPPPPAPSRFDALPALRIVNQTSRESVELRLYDSAGRVDESAALRLDTLLCDARDPKQHRSGRLDRRTLQLLFKAAYHFESREIEVVSAYRAPGRRREGPHGTGAAIDFRLPSVTAAALASYLREIPRTGVGVYTHPKTQYVHLDVREHSFHWLDASPPRRRWREKSIGAKDLERRDATYDAALDLPEP